MKSSKKLMISILGGGIVGWLFGTGILPLIAEEEERFWWFSDFEILLVLGVVIAVSLGLLKLLDYFKD